MTCCYKCENVDGFGGCDDPHCDCHTPEKPAWEESLDLIFQEKFRIRVDVDEIYRPNVLESADEQAKSMVKLQITKLIRSTLSTEKQRLKDKIEAKKGWVATISGEKYVKLDEVIKLLNDEK